MVSLGQFSYLWAKGVIKDVGRVLDIPFEVTNEMTKKIGDESIEQILDSGLLKEYENKYPKLFEYVGKLAGLPKSFGSHPCAVAIMQDTGTTYNAVEFNSDTNTWVLQGDMHTADDLGLVKCDFLGLRTLDVIYDTLDMIGKDYNYIAPHKIDTSDREVWAEFAAGHTDCIFQFESDGMKSMLKDMYCNCIEDLSVSNALYRPGAKAFIPNYINRKKGTEEIKYIHPDLEPILKKTYGIIVFQEQLINIGRLAELQNPDELRKATAKKKPELMAKIEPLLKDGLMNREWTKEQCDKLWETILDFARYSFCRAHACAYGLTAYISMYLKVHHRCEFIAACINSWEGDITGIVKTINEARRMGIEILFDDWRHAQSKTTTRDGKIYLGLNTIKGFGNSIAEALQRIAQKATTFTEVLVLAKQDSDISDSQLETLISHDFFGEFGDVNNLLGIHTIFKQVYGRKTFSKNSELPVSEDVLRMFSKETAKQFRDIKSDELITYLTEHLQVTPRPLVVTLNSELKDFGYIRYTNDKADKMFYITDIDTKYSPKLTFYNLKKGLSFVAKISKKDFAKNPVCVGNLIRADFQVKPKMRKEGDTFVPEPNIKEYWVKTYSIVK